MKWISLVVFLAVTACVPTPTPEPTPLPTPPTEVPVEPTPDATPVATPDTGSTPIPTPEPTPKPSPDIGESPSPSPAVTPDPDSQPVTPTPTARPATPEPVRPDATLDLKVRSSVVTPQSLKPQVSSFDSALAKISSDASHNILVGSKVNDLYVIGRWVNIQSMNLGIAIRATSDKKYSDLIYQALVNQKVNLIDRNKDGFLEWSYYGTSKQGDGTWGTDDHEMDDILAHATTAFMTYIMDQNRSVDARYGEIADFYKKYLKDGFEKKHRTRMKRLDTAKYPTMYSVRAKELTHPFIHWARYHHYTGFLFNDEKAKAAAREMIEVVKKNAMHEIDTPSGKGVVWAHSVDPATKENKSCQMAVYLNLSIPGLTDLYLEGLVGKELLQKVENNFAHNVIPPKGHRKGLALHGDVCGNVARGGLKPMRDGWECTINGKTSRYSQTKPTPAQGEVCELASYDNQSSGNSVRRAFHHTLFLDQSGLHQAYLDKLKKDQAGAYNSTTSTHAAELLKAVMANPATPTPVPATPKPEPTGGVDISEFSVSGPTAEANDLKRILNRTGGYKGGSKGTIEIKENDSLSSETMKITVSKTNVLIEGNPVKWAVSEFANVYLGALFLFPDEVGEYVPKVSKVLIPFKNHTYRPILIRRDFRQHGKAEKIVTWLDRHYLAKTRTGGIGWGHAFGDWWDKYSKTRPELFALEPSGKLAPPPSNEGHRAKLRLGSPEVIKAIKAEWIDKGRPEWMSLSPGDSTNYDTSPETMKLYGLEDTLENRKRVYSGSVSLTDGHVRFWNNVITEIRKERPDFKAGVYAYGAYRDCPKSAKPIEGALSIQFVPSYYASDVKVYDCWAKLAHSMFIRPNWPWNVYASPYLPIREMGVILDHGFENKMQGLDMDSVTSFYGVNGLFNYFVARKMAHPEINTETIIDEYATAFGAAKSEMKDYLKYWLDFAAKVQMPSSAGGGVGGSSDGLYVKAFQAEGFKRTPNPLAGSGLMMPLVFTDEVLNPALALLDKVIAKAQGDDKKRAQFIKDSFTPFKIHRSMMRELINYCVKNKAESKAKSEALHTEFKAAHLKHYGIRTGGITEWVGGFCAGKSLEGL